MDNKIIKKQFYFNEEELRVSEGERVFALSVPRATSFINASFTQ